MRPGEIGFCLSSRMAGARNEFLLVVGADMTQAARIAG